MRFLAGLLGFLAAAAWMGPSGAGEAADLAALKARIAGTWKHQHRQVGVRADTLKQYGADGSYSATSKIHMLGTHSSVDYEGEWEILPGPVLRLKVTKTNNRLYVPMGAVYLMKSLEIDGDTMTYTYDGKPGKEVRQKAASGES